MNCVEFMLMAMRDVRFTSRGEQASFIRHRFDCAGCVKWTQQMSRAVGPPPPEYREVFERLTRELIHDPEALEVIVGKDYDEKEQNES